MGYKPIKLLREPHITDAVLSELQRHYKGLSIATSPTSPTIDLVVAALSGQEVQDLQLDLAFYKKIQDCLWRIFVLNLSIMSLKINLSKNCCFMLKR